MECLPGCDVVVQVVADAQGWRGVLQGGGEMVAVEVRGEEKGLVIDLGEGFWVGEDCVA